MDPKLALSLLRAYALTQAVQPGKSVEPAGKPRIRSKFDQLLDATEGATDATEVADGLAGGGLDQFLREPSPWRALFHWYGEGALLRGAINKQLLVQLLSRDIARLDALLSRQVNAIIHHPQFQRLEASWRGLHYLVHQVEDQENIKVRVLSVSWRELVRDLERAIEFDQSQLFRKVYNEEFGIPGGEPYAVLLGDYEVRHKPGPDHAHDDLGALTAIAHVAAAAFAPFIAGVHPVMFDLTSFTDLEMPLNLTRTFEQLEYLKWKQFRSTEDARFVALTLPRVLMRLPYADGGRADAFRFREDVAEPGRKHYLWGTAVYAFGAVLVRAFAQCGWLADIRGVRRDEVGGGMVAALPVHGFRTDKSHVAPRSSTDALITDIQEKELAELGFMPLCHCPDTELAAFYGTQSAQKPKTYDEPAATINAKFSAMLQYILCVARFAHYLKVIARDKIGALSGPADCERFLTNWLMNYCSGNEEDELETKAKYPLREARVQVKPHPGKPGNFLCVTHLRPHFQLDMLVTSVRLATELSPTHAG